MCNIVGTKHVVKDCKLFKMCILKLLKKCSFGFVLELSSVRQNDNIDSSEPVGSREMFIQLCSAKHNRNTKLRYFNVIYSPVTFFNVI